MTRQTVTATTINLVMGGLMAWVVFRDRDGVSLWGSSGFAIDIIATTLFLTFFTSFFVSKAAYKAIDDGRVTAVEWPVESLFRRMRPRPFVGSLTVAVVAAALIGSLTIGAFVATGATTVDVSTLVTFKALYSAVLAAVVTPLVIPLAWAETHWTNRSQADS